jgi:glycosyltransferase involved in cell wall biosynthesis
VTFAVCCEESREIAVVIPTRDRWPLLRVALGCALAQKGVDVRVLVVDDGSVDATPHELRAIDDARVRVLRHDRPKGVSTARNYGLAHVTLPWVTFLDDDDVWAPGHLAAMFDAVRASRISPDRLGLVFSGSLQVDADWHVTHVLPPPQVKAVLGGMNRFNSVGCPSRVVLRTEAVRSVSGFDDRLSIVADWDLWVRIAMEYEIVRCPELLVGYMLHARNMHLDGDRFLDELAVIQQKYGWTPPAHRPSLRIGRSLPGDIAPGFIASVYRARGRRVRSARWYLRSFRISGDWRDFGRAVGVLFGERIIDLSGLRERKAIDPSVGRWLEHVREASRAATAGLPPMHLIHSNGIEAR